MFASSAQLLLFLLLTSILRDRDRDIKSVLTNANAPLSRNCHRLLQ